MTVCTRAGLLQSRRLSARSVRPQFGRITAPLLHTAKQRVVRPKSTGCASRRPAVKLAGFTRRQALAQGGIEVDGRQLLVTPAVSREKAAELRAAEGSGKQHKKVRRHCRA